MPGVVIAALRLAGVERIVGTGRSPGRRAAARAVGADGVIDTREVALADYVAGTGQRFAAVLDCSGAVGLCGEALEVLAPAGARVAVALTPDVPPVPLFQLVQGGFGVHGTCADSHASYEAAVGHIAAGRVPAGAIISERVSLAGPPSAPSRLRKPGELVRILTMPGEQPATHQIYLSNW